jgi:hypothetical protein
MVGMSRSMLGLESLALMLCLPFALLIWAYVSGSYIQRVSGSFCDRMVFFAAALSVVIFRTVDAVAILIASPVWFAILCLATWLVLAANDIHVSRVSQLRPWVVEHLFGVIHNQV